MIDAPIVRLLRGGVTISTADESKNIFLKRNHNIILFSADSDRSHSVEHVGIFDHKKIPNIDQDIQFNEKILVSLLQPRGTNSTLGKLLVNKFPPKKTISTLVVDRFASEKGCYCALYGLGKSADECGMVELS